MCFCTLLTRVMKGEIKQRAGSDIPAEGERGSAIVFGMRELDVSGFFL